MNKIADIGFLLAMLTFLALAISVGVLGVLGVYEIKDRKYERNIQRSSDCIGDSRRSR